MRQILIQGIARIKQMGETRFLILFLSSVFGYNFILGLQGFDLHDEGFFLTAFQQLFERPASAEFQFLWYNTILSGALWNLVFGKWGILGFRVLAALCYTAIAFVLYYIFRGVIQRRFIVLGCFLILLNNHYVIVFHPNMLTALLYCFACYFIYTGAVSHSVKFLLLSGVLLGVNFFTRLPNVTLTALILAPLYYSLHDKSLKAIRSLFGMLSGMLLGGCVILITMMALGHLETFKSSLFTLFHMAVDSSGAHSIPALFVIFADDCNNIFKQALILITFPILSLLTIKFTQKTIVKIICITILSVLYFLLIWRFHYQIATLYAFCILSLLWGLFQQNLPLNKRLLIIISFLILIFLPIGSDYGVDTMGKNCIWIALPLSMDILSHQEHRGISGKILPLTLFIFIFSFGLSSLYRTSLQCYFDNGNRLKKVQMPKNDLATTFTNSEKCLKIDELFDVLPNYLHEQDNLLCWKSAPMIHYLTHCYPYLHNPWPELYSPQLLELHFQKASSTEKLPVVICNKSCTPVWDHLCPNWDNEDDPQNQLFMSFVIKNDYHIVWENELFRIMLPSSICLQ